MIEYGKSESRAPSFFARWAFFLAGILFFGWVQACENTSLPSVALASLPKEVAETIVLVKRGGPFPYARDGVIFNNYEKRLPLKKRGYYQEYTIRTPGVRGRGARRLIVGGRTAPSPDYFYTSDHYASFQCIKN